MTMIINKNAPEYKNYLLVRDRVKNNTQEDLQLIENMVGNSIYYGTIEGIDDQIDTFTSEKGYVLYAYIEDHGDDEYEVVVSRAEIVAKEVDDD